MANDCVEDFRIKKGEGWGGMGKGGDVRNRARTFGRGIVRRGTVRRKKKC